LRALPDHPDALHYLGVASHQLGDSGKGLEYVRRSLEVAPDHPDALNNLGNIYRECGQLEEARDAYRRALEIAPAHADTLVNLAITLRSLGDPATALEKVKQAINIAPEHVSAHHNLGNILHDLKEYELALTAYNNAIELNPSDEDESTKAIAKILYRHDRQEEAIAMLQRFLAKKPNDEVATHMLAAFSGDKIPRRAPDQYVRQIFDKYSTTFDESLARMDYKAPQLVGARVSDQLSGSADRYRVLDIGCGTGLCGPLIRTIADTLTGVDLSPKMLNMAEKLGVYDRLDEAELTTYMNTKAECFDVITCVDTFCYFGALSDAFAAAFRALRPHGWLFFTVEQHSVEECSHGHRLQYHGRYSHTREYLRDTLTASGFELRDSVDVILRTEVEEPVSGILTTAQKQ
jgi:predicted TPR repeat methyltransferase